MQLHAAAARGDVDAIASALESGACINQKNRSGQTALSFALEEARAFNRRKGPLITPAAVAFLVRAGAELELPDDLGATPIHHAAAIADIAFLDLILHLGGNAKHVTGSNYSVVTSASYQPSSRAKRAIIRRLAAAGASLDLPTIYGESPLSVCLYFGDLESLRLLIELGADPGPLDWTALHKCVALGGVSHIQALNPDSTEINRLNSRFQLSPWLLAFVRGDQQIVDWLAERGADLDQASHTGGSLCHLAARFGHVEILRWLESRSADPNAQDSFASSPLHEAAAWDHVDCASALIEFGAEVASEDHVQSQAIHGARSIRMLEVLCQAGADINAVSGTGEWPLQFAAEDNDVERLKWLLNNGAAVDQNSTGATALHTAVQRDSREAVNLLLRAGANPNQEDVDGQTPLFMAQSVETIKALLIAGADRKISDQAGRFPKGCLTDPLLKRALKHL